MCQARRARIADHGDLPQRLTRGGGSQPVSGDVLRKVNRQLYPDIKEDMFISMAYLILNHQRDGITLARPDTTLHCFTSASQKRLRQ